MIAKNLLLYNLINYINSNIARDPKDYKSIIGYFFFLNKVVLS